MIASMQTSNRIHIPTDEDYIQNLNDLMPPDNYGFNIDFSLYRNFFAEMGLDCPLDFLKTIPDRAARAKATEEVYSAAWERLMSDDTIRAAQSKRLTAMWRYLSKHEALEPADAILVVGGKKTWRRGRVALELIQRGLSKNIIVTGDRPFFDKAGQKGEAFALEAYLLKRGIKPSQLTIEAKAKSTTENVYMSYLALKEIGPLPKSLIIVANPMQMLRIYYSFKVIGPRVGWEPKLIRKSITLHHSRFNFYTDFVEFSLLMNEFTKIYYSFCQNDIR